MRLLVSDNELFAEIYRVNFYKSKHWSVIGEQLLFSYLQALIPHGTKFHSHFIYAETGDYHFSIKYFDTIENLYVDRKTYHNHIATRKSTTANFTPDIPVERRNINFDDPLDCFMMGERLKPWSERPLNHHFGTVALNLTAGKPDHLNWDKTISVTADDLVINLHEHPDAIINLGVGLFSTGHPAFEPANILFDKKWIEKSIIMHDLVLRLSAIIV